MASANDPTSFLHRHFGDGGCALVDWERYDEDRPAYPPRSLEHIIEYHRAHAAEKQPDANIFEHAVDVGAGPGTLLPTIIAPHFAKATLVDLHATQLEVAKRRFEHLTKDSAEGKSDFQLKSLQTIQCPGEAMPLDDACADLVISGEAVQWLEWRKFLQEAKRILKPGGTLAVLFYVPVLRFMDAEADAIMTQMTEHLLALGGHDRRKAPLPASCNRLIASSFDELDLHSAGFVHEERNKHDEWPAFQHPHAETWDDHRDVVSGISNSHADAFFMQKPIASVAMLQRVQRSLAYWDEGLEADGRSDEPQVPIFLRDLESIIAQRGQPLVAYLPYFEILGTKP